MPFIHVPFPAKGFFANGTGPTEVSSLEAECKLRKNPSYFYCLSPPRSPPPPAPPPFTPSLPPPPQFYCFPSSSSASPSSSSSSSSPSVLLFSFRRHHSIKDCKRLPLVHFAVISRVVKNNRGFLQLLGPVSLKECHSTTYTLINASLIQCAQGIHPHPRRK